MKESQKEVMILINMSKSKKALYYQTLMKVIGHIKRVQVKIKLPLLIVSKQYSYWQSIPKKTNKFKIK